MPTCQKCQGEFPNWIKVEGLSRNLSKRKFCLTCSPFGSNHNSDLTKHQQNTMRCSRCHEFRPRTEFYRDRIGMCKSCHLVYGAEKRKEFKLLCIAYKGGKCELCSYTRCAAGLEFHHRDPSQKDFEVNRNARRSLVEVLRKELDKCALLCATCHREVHAGIAFV